MKKPGRLITKPGAANAPFKPDSIKAMTVKLPPEAQPVGLMEFISTSLPDLKRTSIKEMLKYGQVMVDGQPVSKFDHPLDDGAEVKVNFTRPFQVFRNPRLKMVYEDDDIIVVNKGYGLLSVGSDKEKDKTAYSMLYEYLKRKDPRNKIFVVHRLDQHTSGLMMFAKNIRAKNAMQHNWNNMVIDRRYVAVTEGAPEPAEGKFESYLAENAVHKVYSVKEPDENARQAVTYYKVLKKRGNYALVELTLATGRKNQIRVHLSEAGHPIAGDRKYGAHSSPINRLALHAQTLRFVHPVTRKDMNFTCPLPPQFGKLV